MPRRREVPKRTILPDPKFGDQTVAKFINVMMLDGKKSIAERIIYGALDIISERGAEKPLDVFYEALDNIRPVVEVKSRRVGGATYQVPIQVHDQRAFALASRWLIGFAKSRKGSMAQRLAAELIAAANEEGGSVKKKEDTHRMAEANKAFAHYGRRR